MRKPKRVRLQKPEMHIAYYPYNHMLTHIKTTLDLPDDLLMEAKSMALQRRTTLKSLVEHALRREIQGRQESAADGENRFQQNELGFLMLKRSPSDRIRLEDIQRVEEEMDEEEIREILNIPGRSRWFCWTSMS